MRWALAALVAAWVHVSSPPRAEACAGCRNPSLAVTRGSEGPLESGALRAGLTATATAIHVVHEAGCRSATNCREVPVQPAYLHDQRLYPLELRLVAEYAVSETLGVEVHLPLRVVRSDIEYKTLAGASYEPLDAGVHHRNETVGGLADPWLLHRAGTQLGEVWFATRFGLSLPLGSTERNPFLLGDRGLRHQHIQLGSGTFDPVVVVEASRKLDRSSFQLFAQAQLPLYENRHGYQAPLRIYGGASVGTKLVDAVTGTLGPEAFHEAAERWNGERRQDGSLGRSELLAAASLSRAFGKTELTLSARFPLWRHIVVGDEPPGTLSSPAIVSLGFSHVFGS